MSRRRPHGLGGLARLTSNPVLTDAVLLFVRTLVIAGGGAVFWVVAARLAPTSTVGVAASLISAATALAFIAQLGLNFAMVQVLPHSDSPAADVVTASAVVAGAAVLLGSAFAIVAARVSPSLAFLDDSPLTVLAYGLLVAGVAVVLLIMAAFLALRRVPTSVVVNGVLVALGQVALPFALFSTGAFGLFAAWTLPSAVAAVVGLVLLARLPRRGAWLRLSTLRSTARFSGAGYLTSALDMVPLLVIPLVVTARLGPSDNGIYYVAFQVAMLLNMLILVIVQSMFAEGSRRPQDAVEISRRSGRLLVLAVTAGVAVLVVSAPLLLSVFGGQYADDGAATLRVLAVAGFGVALQNWTVMRLRLTHDLSGSILMQSVTCAGVLSLALALSGQGLVWVALAWGAGHALGGLVGLARIRLAPHEPPVPATAPDPAVA